MKEESILHGSAAARILPDCRILLEVAGHTVASADRRTALEQGLKLVLVHTEMQTAGIDCYPRESLPSWVISSTTGDDYRATITGTTGM